MLLWAHLSPGKSSHWPLAYCIAPETQQQLNVLVRLCFIVLFFLFLREMTGRTSLAFPIPFVFHLPLVLVTLTSFTLLSCSISSEHFRVPGFIQRENRAETEVCFMGARASLEMRLLWGFLKSPFGSEPDTPCGRNPSTYFGWSHAGGKSSKCCCRPVFSTMVFSIEDLKGLRKKKISSNWRSEQLKWKYFECDNLCWYFMNCSFVSPGHCFLSLITVIQNHFPSVKCAACLDCLLLGGRPGEGCRSIPTPLWGQGSLPTCVQVSPHAHELSSWNTSTPIRYL